MEVGAGVCSTLGYRENRGIRRVTGAGVAGSTSVEVDSGLGTHVRSSRTAAESWADLIE